MTPFQLACGYGNWAAVVFMLQGGHVDDISRTDHQGRTAMDHAAQSPLIRTILVAYAKQYSLTVHRGDVLLPTTCVGAHACHNILMVCG